MIVHTDPQGSEAWLIARRGVITGSRFKDCRDFNKLTAAEIKAGATRGKPSAKLLGYAQDTARERVGGKVLQPFQNLAMRTGQDEEPHARYAYEELTGDVVLEAGFITTDDGRFGVSVDGLVGTEGAVEIKTMVSSATLFKAVVEQDHSEYIDQINGAMWLLGLRWVDLVLWAPDLAPIDRALTVRRIERDEKAIRELEADLLAFAALVDDFEAALRAPQPLAA